MPVSDTWDWPALLYIATTILGRSEREFWRMTPRKLNVLSKAHVKMKGGDDKSSSPGAPKGSGYIDQVI